MLNYAELEHEYSEVKGERLILENAATDAAILAVRAKREFQDFDRGKRIKNLIAEATEQLRAKGIAVPESTGNPFEDFRAMINLLAKPAKAQRYANNDQQNLNSLPGRSVPSGKYELRKQVTFNGRIFEKYSTVDVADIPADRLGAFQLLIDQKKAVKVREPEVAA